MKKITFFLLLAALVCANAYANETARFALGDWEPYTSATDAKSKLLEKVVAEAFKLENVDVHYDYFPWKRSYLSAKEGNFAGTFPWAKTEGHQKDFIIHKMPLINDEGVYFHLKSNPFDWSTIEDLKKYTVGVTLGYKEEAVYKAKGINAEAVPSEDLNFKKILAGRIDVYQTSKIVGYTTIHKLFSPEEAKRFTTHPTPAVKNEFFILFSKKIPNGQALADKFDSGLKKLKESGAYDKIIGEDADGSGTR